MATFVDLFCGGGFGARGAVRGGGVPLLGLDAWALATQTYKTNFPESEIITDRIENVDIEALGERFQPDVLLTSPECTSHSIARGARPGLETSRETAIGIVPWVRSMEPRWVIVENVQRMKKWDRHNELKRTGKCLGLSAFIQGAMMVEGMARRDGEHPYELTTLYFDETFVGADERLDEWPADVDVDKLSEDVNIDAFFKRWDELLNENRRERQGCNFLGKRSLDRRCSQKRSLQDFYGIDIYDEPVGNTTGLVQADMYPRSLEARNPLALLFQALAQFFTRVGQQLVARAVGVVAARSPRLANLIRQAPERLFQIARNGESKASQQSMKNARDAIAKKDEKAWKRCLKDGMP